MSPPRSSKARVSSRRQPGRSSPVGGPPAGWEMWACRKPGAVCAPADGGSEPSGGGSTPPWAAWPGDDAMTNDRRKRQLKILEMIETRALRTQEDVAEALASEGWDVTQSSVSRDIAALGLIKVGGAYRRPEGAALVAEDPDERRIAEGVLAAEPAGDALVVLHTPPGEANRVAVALDRLAWPDVVGTLAGDDTIFLAVKDGSAQRRVLGEVRKLTG